MTELLNQMVESRQLSASDANWLIKQKSNGAEGSYESETEILQWLAEEYSVSFSDLENLDISKEVLSLFPARLLLKEGLLPLRHEHGSVDIATSRLFATQGLDTLKSLTGLKLNPVLAPTEAIQREIKKRLGVGADTIDTLKDDSSFQVVDKEDFEDNDLENAAEDASIIRFVNQASVMRLIYGPRTSIWNPSKMNFKYDTALTVSCRRCPYLLKSNAFNQPLFLVSKS